MTEERFSELVNLYLDKEISAEDLDLLKAELAENSERKSEFQERCRLHQAMRLAMGAPTSKRSSRSSKSASSRRSRSQVASRGGIRRSRATTGSTVNSRGQRSAASSRKAAKPSARADLVLPVSHFPRWILALGLAACLALGVVLLFPVFTDTTHISKQSLEGLDEDELKESVDPLDAVERSDLRRFVTIQESRNRRSASLAAELRLLGLHPEVMDEEAALSEVSLASIQPRNNRERRLEMLNHLKEYTPIPEPRILHSSEARSERSYTWPAGFKTSLANFK
ncbi:MAG TPA: hypothetical protein DCX06_05365 [Opitutae bacterium]|nr:hypothetical protein [Opitutae bacterium]